MKMLMLVEVEVTGHPETYAPRMMKESFEGFIADLVYIWHDNKHVSATYRMGVKE